MPPLLLQNYSHASDHRIINNHAMLMFGGRFENTVVMMADADEFFVPQVISCTLVLWCWLDYGGEVAVFRGIYAVNGFRVSG